MTLDDTTLGTALRDLAATAPENPARLAQVHRLARRRHHRQRALGAGALAATIAAGVAGANALASGGGGTAAGIRPASGGSVGTAATPGALPACPANPPQAADKPAAPPTVGQVFTGGGTITAPGTASSVQIQVDGGPMIGSDLTLTIGPSSQISVDGKPATGAQVVKGARAKFSATRLSATTYFVDELHAGTADATAAPKQAAAGTPATPAVGDGFKVMGTVTTATATTITVDVTGGSLPPGPVTVTLTCAPTGPLTGRTVSIAGTRTATGFEATALEVMGP